METNSIVKSFMIEKILKIDFQNVHISWNVSKSISWTFLGSLHNETIVKYVFHEVFWKNYFTVYSRLEACNFIKKETLAQVFRGGSRTAATSKMDLFEIIVNGFQPSTIIKKCSILDVTAVLDPPLGVLLWILRNF